MELRRTINAATNKSEEFNDFIQWLFFGGDGIIAENIRHEQRKVVKYNQLVANMVCLIIRLIRYRTPHAMFRAASARLHLLH